MTTLQLSVAKHQPTGNLHLASHTVNTEGCHNQRNNQNTIGSSV
jgi:hypothetical protein